MPELMSDAGTVVLRLELLENQWLDVDPGRPDFENWIPFSLSVIVNGEVAYAYPASFGATFTLVELKGLIDAFRRLVKTKKDGLEVERFEFGTLEAYFDWTPGTRLSRTACTYPYGSTWVRLRMANFTATARGTSSASLSVP